MLTDDDLGVRLRTRLYDEVAEVTAAPDLPATLRRRARWATVARASLVAGLALVAAAGGVVARGNGSPSPEPLTAAPINDIAYLSGQADAALAHASDFLLKTEYTDERTGFSTVYLLDLQTYRARFDSVGPEGPACSQEATPVADAPAGTQEILVLDHPNRAWWRHTLEPIIMPDGRIALPSTPAFHDPSEIRDAMNSGALTLVGHEQIDGRDAWHLQTEVHRLDKPYGTLDIYVDQQTYLPMRIVNTKLVGDPTAFTANLTWLPRTDENLALLDLRVPDGYTYHESPIEPEPGGEAVG